MYRLISTASTTRGNILAVCPPHGFNCRDNQVNAYTGILTYPYTHNKSSLCALHNQYKHLEIVAMMNYTRYVVLLTQLCMDGPNILHRGQGAATLYPCPHYPLPRILILPHDTNSVNRIFQGHQLIQQVSSLFFGELLKILAPVHYRLSKTFIFGLYAYQVSFLLCFYGVGTGTPFYIFYELNVSFKITHMYNLYYFCHMCKLKGVLI